MTRRVFQRITLGLFLLYVAMFPGSTIVVALDMVPAWGTWMGPALLLLQGITAICWLIGMYGWRGLLAALTVLLLGWSAEHLGETTGLPFGWYAYTDQLQPQIMGVVPVPIMLAWLMVALGSWQLAQVVRRRDQAQRFQFAPILLTAVLVVTLDLQIETVATLVNSYWRWIDTGPFYGVPTLNFFGWLVVGLLMGVVLHGLLPQPQALAPHVGTVRGPWWTTVQELSLPLVPLLLYFLSSVMFTIVNLARGYPLAGVVGIIFLGIALLVAARGGLASVAVPVVGRTTYQSQIDRA